MVLEASLGRWWRWCLLSCFFLGLDNPLLVGSAVVGPVTQFVATCEVATRDIEALAKGRFDDVLLRAIWLRLNSPNSGTGIKEVSSIDLSTVITLFISQIDKSVSSHTSDKVGMVSLMLDNFEALSHML